MCAKIIRDKSPAVIAAVERMRGFTKDESNAEYTFLHLIASAKETSEGTGAPIEHVINYLIDKWAEKSHSSVSI